MSAPSITQQLTDVSQPQEHNDAKGKPSEQTAQEKYKVKVNGKEEEVTLEDLKRSYNLDKASRQRFDEAAKKIKDAENLKNMYSSKEWDNLLKAGWTEEELEERAADFIIKRAQKKSMTPEQLKQMEIEEDYKRLKKKELDAVELKNRIAEQQANELKAKETQTNFMNDLKRVDKNTWLDLNDPVILSTIISEITSALTKHSYDMPVSEAVKRLEERLDKKTVYKKEYLKKLMKSSIKDLDDSDLEAFLEKGGKGVREKSLEALRRTEAPFAKKNTPQMQSNPGDTAPKKDLQYYRRLRNKIGT